MNFIKKIFDGKKEESIHLQFQKFSKGEFRNRALIRVKKTKDKFTIFTSAEFANGLVKNTAEKLGNEKTLVKGAIVSTNDLTGELNFKGKKQFQGVKRYLIENEMSGEEILKLLEKFPRAFFAISFDAGETKLKIKPKAPKSGKPGSKKEELPKIDFCKLITTDKQIGESFVFDTLQGTSKPDFKEAIIDHTFFIEDIVMPKGETDYAKIRETAVRKGRIIRKSEIDGKKMIQEFKFEA
ncbi:MAG: hypothetical protein KJ646_04890 [Nanoarchaeota archaeon]|nr:hypothetical protein [Nanoarchaeota archaeon]MBU4117056.1 hypothetical protein [Nanoarchaeota archaeon]